MTYADRFESKPLLRRPGAATAASRDQPSAEPALLADLARLVDRARKADAQFGSRIQLLYLACEQAELPVPGVAALPMRHELPPAGEVLITYLVANLPISPALAKAVRVAVFRYTGLLEVLAVGERAIALGVVAPFVLEQLRQQLFFLGHYYEDFRDDPVMCGLFPAPTVVAGPPPKGAATVTARLPDEAKARREGAVVRAQALARTLAPGLARVVQVLAMVDGGPTLKVADLLSPQGRSMRMLALTLPSSPDVLARLREAAADWERFEAALEATRKGADAATLIEVGETLARFPATCRESPLLRDLFPPSATPTTERPRALSA